MTRPRPKPAPAADIADMPEAVELAARINAAASGTAIVYYTGDLSADALNDIRVQAIRMTAWDATCLGKVDLVQRRTNRVGVFEYVAVKR